MVINRLSDRAVRMAKCPPNRPAIMLNDGGGLLLRVSRTGSKSWIYRYMLCGTTHDVGLGPFHTVSLAEARDAALECRKIKLTGKDPLAMRRAVRRQLSAIPTFEEFAETYVSRQAAGWRGQNTQREWRQTLGDYAYPILGSMRLDEIETDHVRRALLPVWSKLPEQGKRTRRRVETILAAATAEGFRSGDNPARWTGYLEHLLEAVPAGNGTHHEAMPYMEVPAFLRALTTQRGDAARALRFLIVTGVRRGELLGATWDEFDLKEQAWAIPVTRMKEKRWGDFRVPLSDVALMVLSEIGREGPKVFPIHNSAMPMLLRRRGLKVTVHGFRSSFSTWAADRTDAAAEVREACLAHYTGNQSAKAYQRGQFFDKRRELMSLWARFCSAPVTGSTDTVVR
jgi:integrase